VRRDGKRDQKRQDRAEILPLVVEDVPMRSRMADIARLFELGDATDGPGEVPTLI
jgi:hypothetical protein